MKLSCSMLSVFDRIKFLKMINDTDIDYVHIDVMDGKFVSNIAYSLEEIFNINRISNKKLDIHLMVNEPSKYIENLKDLKIEYITFHVEVTEDINELIDMVHNMGYKCGLAIKPNSKISILEPYLNKIDLILVMSVMPGYGGQSFIESTFDKLKEIKTKYKDIYISVDGGINQDNIYKLSNLVNMVVIGSYLTKDTKKRIEIIKSLDIKFKK